MKEAVRKLGIDPEFHDVSAEPHQLIIIDQGAPYIHTFDTQPGMMQMILLHLQSFLKIYCEWVFISFLGVFGCMILQIPVEGGHRGGELTVFHQLGSNIIECQDNNGKTFFLSVSFIDCQHEISAVTDGWSLMMAFNLKWKNPIKMPPDYGLSLPLFVSNLNTVRAILSPLSPDKTEVCDTDLLVVPLKYHYKKNSLHYDCLKGTDQLMASLLQAVDYLEVRLAFVKLLRGGFVYDEQQRNRDREDDGYPESDEEEFEEEAPHILNYNRRSIEVVQLEKFSVGKLRRLSGKICSISPDMICWETDSIDRDVKSIEDFFEFVGVPDREEFDAHHCTDDRSLLKQWYYEPVLVFWPKESIVLKCRTAFMPTLRQLSTALVPSSEKERRTRILELRSVINYVFCEHYRNGLFYSDAALEILLQVCNQLKARDEGLFLYNLELKILNGKTRWGNSCFLAPMSQFICLFGWSTCEKFFDTIVRSIANTYGQKFVVYQFLLRLIFWINFSDRPLYKEAAGMIFHRAACETITSTRIELFHQHDENVSLLKLSNDFQRKEEGLQIFSAFARQVGFKWCYPDVIKELERFVVFAGWNDCQGFINIILHHLSLSSNGKVTTTGFLLKLELALLKQNELIRNEAVVMNFRLLLCHMFPLPPTENELSYDSFFNGIGTSPINQTSDFFLVLLKLDHRHLLEDTRLMDIATTYIETVACQRLHFIPEMLIGSFLSDLRLDQTTSRCLNFLELVSHRLLNQDYSLIVSNQDFFFIRCLSRLFVF